MSLPTSGRIEARFWEKTLIDRGLQETLTKESVA